MVSSESNNKSKNKNKRSNTSRSTESGSQPAASESVEVPDMAGGNVVGVGKGKSNEKEIAVIGDEDTVIAFGLTGIKHLISIDDNTNDKEIISSIKQFINTPEIGFVLITQPIAERIRLDFERIKSEKSLYPIFIELPDKHGEKEDREDPIKTLIRRAIGMDVIKK